MTDEGPDYGADPGELLEYGRQKGTDRVRPKAPRRRGRPTRLTPAVRGLVVRNILAGAFQETAAIAAGVPKSTYHSWKARGEEVRSRLDAEWGGDRANIPEEERPYVEFLDAIEEARAQVELRYIEAVERVSLGGEVESVHEWEDDAGRTHRRITFRRPASRPMTWFLERSFPERYARRIEVGGPEGGPIPVEVEVSARDLLKRRLEEMAERTGQEAEAG